MRRTLVVAVLALTSCLDTQVPPLPGAGSIQGTLLTVVPGSPTPVPAARGSITLVESGLSVETTMDGRFELSPVPRAEGTLVFSANGLKRVLSLEGLRAGPGRTTALGNVVLGANASVQGQVLLEDSAQTAGTLVFVEGELAIGFSTGDGQFLLRDLPAGPLRVAFVREGYVPVTRPVELRSGERLLLDPVTLRRLPPGLTSVRVSGRALLADAADASGISVSIDGVSPASTNAAGDYAFASISIGVHTVKVEKAGYRAVVLQNRLVGTEPLVLPTVTLVPGSSTAVVVPWRPVFDAGAGLPDAGGMDSGVADAGGGDAGVLDAGVVDAGEPDAGTSDSGVTDSGVTDSGTVDSGVVDAGTLDGGADAGPPIILPRAVIGPLPARVLFSSPPFQLDGLASTGFPAISRYVWTVDTGLARLPDGGAVTVSPNDSGVAWAPFMPLPAPPALVSLTLRVVDLAGRVSDPATAGFVVGDRPLALFDAGSLPNQLYSHQTATLDATPSRDPMNSGIVSRRWEVSAGAPVTTSPLDGGATLTLTTLTVPISQMVTVSHWVTSGLGFESLARQHTLSLIAGPVPQPAPWSVTTAGAFSVDGGAFIPLVAGLDAGANGPLYADPDSYTFSWVSLTDAGTPPRWTIGDPSARSTSVFLPIIDGPPQRFDFEVTATARPPLLPGSTRAGLSVQAFDRIPPRITAVSVASTASIMGVTLDFSEPMDLSTSLCLMSPNANCTVLRAAPTTAFRTSGKLSRNNRVLYVTRPPFGPEVRTLVLGGATADVVGNPVTPLPPAIDVDFLAEERWTPLILAVTGSSTVPPAPDVVMKALALPTEHAALVMASNGVDAVAVRTGTLSTCSTPPCATTTSVFGPSASTTPTRPVAFSSGGLDFFQPGPGEVLVVDGGTLPLAPGPVFPDGRGGLSTIYVSGASVRIADFVDGGWDFANELPVEDGGVPAGSQLSAAVVGTTTRQWCVVRRSGTSIRVLTRSGTGRFAQPLINNPALVTYQVRDAWVYGATPNFCHVAFLGVDDQPIFIAPAPGDFTFTTNSLFTTSPTPLAAFDVAIDPFPLLGVVGRWWAVVTQTGQLNLHYTQGVQDLLPANRVTPPGGAASLNANPACVAAHPRVVPLEQAVYVVWQEQCAGQPWRVYLRGLQ
jgi:hypothetical protein